MARPKKTGLDYFPFDVDFFEDEKIIAIAGEFKIKGLITTIKLLCAIYRNGYFIEWNEILRLKLVCQIPEVSVGLIEQIVNRLVKWGFFDKNLFYSAKILTSKGIQRRYFEAVKRRCNNNDLPYLLINVRNNAVNVYNNSINVCENATKESKVNKIKEKSTYVDEKKSSSPKTVLDQEINDLKNDAIWLDSLQVVHRMGVEKLKFMLDKFRTHCIAEGIICHQNERDAKQHFNNWLRKQLTGKNAVGHGTSEIYIPTLEDNLKEEKQKDDEEHKRILGIYEMAKKKPGSRYVKIVNEWAENGMLERHGLKPLKN